MRAQQPNLRPGLQTVLKIAGAVEALQNYMGGSGKVLGPPSSLHHPPAHVLMHLRQGTALSPLYEPFSIWAQHKTGDSCSSWR